MIISPEVAGGKNLVDVSVGIETCRGRLLCLRIGKVQFCAG